MGLLISIMGIILPNIPQESLSAFFHFNTAWELVEYVGVVVITILGVVVTFQVLGILLILWGQIFRANVEIVEYIQSNTDSPYVSLEIINHEKSDLTECYGTLVLIENYYTPETKLNIFDEVNPNRKLLSWGGGSTTEYVAIPRNHGRKILNIAKLTDNGGFVFLFHGWQSGQKSVGKYHVVVDINGKIDNVPIRTVRYVGCFRSENYITPLVPVKSGHIGKDGELSVERVVTYGGNPATKLDFVKCD